MQTVSVLFAQFWICLPLKSLLLNLMDVKGVLFVLFKTRQNTLLKNSYFWGQKVVLMKTVHSEVCGLLFLEKNVSVEPFKCYFPII